MYLCMYVCMYVCMCVYVCTYVCVQTFIHACMQACMFMCIHVCVLLYYAALMILHQIILSTGLLECSSRSRTVQASPFSLLFAGPTTPPRCNSAGVWGVVGGQQQQPCCDDATHSNAEWKDVAQAGHGHVNRHRDSFC